VEVVAAAEPLLEVRDPDSGSLARLAWQLGDRHIPVQILSKRLRLVRTAENESMLLRFGATAQAIEAPFEPEGGAYRGDGTRPPTLSDRDHAQGGHDHAHEPVGGALPHARE